MSPPEVWHHPAMTLQDELSRTPKTELHQHVDGSIPLPLIWKLMVQHGLNPVGTREEMDRLLVLQPEEEGSLLKYLDKFHYPLWITQFYENIVEVTQAIVEEAARHGVTLLELRYSPIIHTFAGLTLRQAIRAVLTGLNRGCAEKDLKVGLTIIAMRHHGPHIAKILARQAISESQAFHRNSGVIGFDIAGAEKGNPPRLFADAYEIARKGGLGLTAHVGEDEGPEMIWEAVDHLGVTRLGHACSAVRDKDLMRRLARDRVLVECCLTSNFQTGAASRSSRPPILDFLEADIPVAVCTDNTTVSGTNQSAENALLARDLPAPEIARIHKEARGFSFIRMSPAS
ncbi:MAG TPA: adenosine deaminase family protein [Candidatus Polarisedimenticolia bacterium]|nr:adenosine deaminase family protein [Candidatus Polarisedimenticolia bacterium]